MFNLNDNADVLLNCSNPAEIILGKNKKILIKIQKFGQNKDNYDKNKSGKA